MTKRSGMQWWPRCGANRQLPRSRRSWWRRKRAQCRQVARKHRVAANLVFRWRQHQQEVAAGEKSTGKPVSPFVPVALPAPSAVMTPAEAIERSVIEIELASGQKVRVDA